MGFSLVETSLAIGIFACCFLPLIGLVTTGMRVGQDACTHEKANQITASVAAEIEGVSSVPGTTESLFGLSLSNQGTQTRKLDASGLTNYSSSDPSYSLAVVITTNALTRNNCARICVAWPSTAIWNSNLNSWSNALGKVENTILYNSP